MSAPRLSIVVVNWNGGDRVVANVATVLDLVRRRGDSEVVVVDNASNDGSDGRLESLGQDLKLLRQPRNLGFGPASNLGVESARGDLVMLLNPDARPLPAEDPLQPLLDAAANRPDRAGFAPRLLDAPPESGGVQREAQDLFQFRRLWTVGAVARELLLVNRLFPRSRAFRRERYLDVDRDRPFDVEQPAAAALVLRREVFRRLGGFDPRFVPAWWEDVDLAKRLADAGERIVTVPDSRFLHSGGSSVGEGGLGERNYRRLFGRNLLRYADKWWGGGAVLLLRWALLKGGFLRLLLALLGVRGDRPRRVTIEAALGTIASGFSPLGPEQP